MTPFSTYESTYPSTHGLNWLLRKAIRASTSRRSIVRELTGLETPFAAYTPVERMLSKVHLIRRIAEVNPIMIEKILSCPETRFAVETILRHAEPETLLLVEKLIRKNIPSYLIKDVTRRIAKNLIHSSKYSKYSKRSIISELYPTSELFHSYESPIFSNDFESIFSTRSAKKDSIRRLIKSVAGVYHPESKIFSEDSFESVFSPLSSKHSIRRLIKSEKVEKTILKKLIKSVLRHETPLLSTVSPKMMEKSIRKLVKKIVKVNRFDFDTTSTKVHFCHFCNTVCESTLYTVSPICNKCNVVCGEHDNMFSNNVFSKLF
jgi:ribosomal protein L17